jgi:lipopolysaccharide/colanic/teichoic acid biosynthesis glycosyltransferase
MVKQELKYIILPENSWVCPECGIYLKICAWNISVRVSCFIKRLFDIVFSLFFIVVFTPVYIITAIAIYTESPGPVIYRQTRVGKNGRLFPFYKFRSMLVNADRIKDKLQADNESEDGVIFKMKKDPRITGVGRIIRKLSIDELPQLYNVLIGDMSLVGPRPPIPGEVAEYTLEDRKRLHVTPGITCLWQIAGRSDIPFKKQVELDKKYILKRSMVKDIIILILTVPAVITGRGAY